MVVYICSEQKIFIIANRFNRDLAAAHGCTEIVKILALLTDKPNASNNCGYTPIDNATRYGHTEIVNILATFDKTT